MALGLQKKLLGYVTRQMEEDAAWRVIVLKNCWLCPFCGEIGAEELSMAERVEEKIARHLMTCPEWESERTLPLDLATLQRRAQIISFKHKISRTIGRDPNWQILDEEGCWLCPYCARATDINLREANRSPEARDHALTKLARHLLECPDCRRGEGAERPREFLESRLARINRKKKERKLRRRMAAESVWSFRDTDKRWLCPFCAQTPGFRLRGAPDSDAMVERILGHLDACQAYRVRGGNPLEEAALRSRVSEINKERVLDRLRRKLEQHETWQFRDAEGTWYCPYCARPAGFRISSFRPVPSESLEAVWSHLKRCEAYATRKARIKSKNFLRNVVQAGNERLARLRAIRRNLAEEPNWSVCDLFGSWICPYCRKVNKAISFLEDTPLVDKTVEQILDHLEAHCPAHAAGREPASREELEEIAGTLDRGSGVLAAADLSASRVLPVDERWKATIDREMRELRSQLLVSAEIEKSLEEARSKQMQMFPSIPEIDSYEFACLYKPCSTVGGDFYNFVRVSDRHLGIAIGDISGHGYDAALLVGVSKKLLEVYGRNRTSAAQTLILANADVYPDLDAKTFLTVFYGVLDIRARRFSFSRAGHNPLVLYNPARTPPLQILDSKGMALGMDKGPIFATCIEEVEIQLQPGDVLLQYTDGVTETMNRQKEEFGEERLYRLVEQFGRQEAEYLLYKIDRALDRFREGARQKDDITMIAVKVH